MMRFMFYKEQDDFKKENVLGGGKMGRKKQLVES